MLTLTLNKKGINAEVRKLAGSSPVPDTNKLQIFKSKIPCRMQKTLEVFKPPCTKDKAVIGKTNLPN